MGAKILIADDDTYIRTLIMRVLVDVVVDEEVEFLVAEDGETALTIVKEKHPDLVLLDVMMPKMNGFEVCHAIKHELDMQDITVVLLTAKGQELDKQRGAEAGADRYITKPFDPDALLAMTIDILKQ